MTPSPPRRTRIAAAVATLSVLLLLPAAIGQNEPKDELGERLKAEASALAKSGIPLTPDEFEPGPLPDPPAEIIEAGEEFVAAWREYQQSRSLKSKKKPSAPALHSKNFVTHSKAHDKLFKALMHSDRSPQPEEFAQFYYNDYNSFCGDSITYFEEANTHPILLSCLLNKRYREAVDLLLEPGRFTELKRTILPALGFDLPKLSAGAWLSGSPGHLESLCYEGSDYAATLALRWAELGWTKVVESPNRWNIVPEVPTLELLLLLKDGNDVRHETKQQISQFLSENATRLYPHERWLEGMPRGAEKWLISIAQEALNADRNSTRILGAKSLRNAGVEVAQPELRPAPRYRLFLNDQLWVPSDNDSSISFSVRYAPNAVGASGTGGAVKVETDGTLALDPDLFSPGKSVNRAYFYGPHATEKNSGDRTVPWISADIPFPAKFGETTDIRVKTVQLTIKPKLPRPVADYADKVISLDFGIGKGNDLPYPTRSYSVSPTKPLVLERVQPGEYWYRFQVPGAVMTSWEKIQVTEKARILEPKFERGSTVIVPLSLPERAKPETFRRFIQIAYHAQLSNRTPCIFDLERDGKHFEWPQQSFPIYNPERDTVALVGLPIGQYKLTFRSSQDVRKALPEEEMKAEGIAGWQSAAVSFAITAKTPFQLHTNHLKIGASYSE